MSMTDPAVSSDRYTYDYYQRVCQGAHEFQVTGGESLTPRLRLPLEALPIEAGMRILDVGCGRGEVMLHCARRGAHVWGLDYARAAVEIANEALQAAETPTGGMQLLQADARSLPMPSNFFDRAFMLDVVEHLMPDELHAALVEVRRVLRPGGALVIHTMPNTWYYAVGYPLYRLVQRVRGVRIPPNPRDRWDYADVHVNEQNIIRLRAALQAAGFETNVWLQSTETYDYERNVVVRAGMRALVSAPLLRYVFCNDLFAVGRKAD